MRYKCLRNDQREVNRILKAVRKHYAKDRLRQVHNVRVEQIKRMDDASYDWSCVTRPDYWSKECEWGLSKPYEGADGSNYWSGETRYLFRIYDAEYPWFDIIVAFRYLGSFGLTSVTYLKEQFYVDRRNKACINFQPNDFFEVVNEFVFQAESLYENIDAVDEIKRRIDTRVTSGIRVRNDKIREKDDVEPDWANQILTYIDEDGKIYEKGKVNV